MLHDYTNVCVTDYHRLIKANIDHNERKEGSRNTRNGLKTVYRLNRGSQNLGHYSTVAKEWITNWFILLILTFWGEEICNLLCSLWRKIVKMKGSRGFPLSPRELLFQLVQFHPVPRSQDGLPKENASQLQAHKTPWSHTAASLSLLGPSAHAGICQFSVRSRRQTLPWAFADSISNPVSQKSSTTQHLSIPLALSEDCPDSAER